MKQNRSLPIPSAPMSWQVHVDWWRASGLGRAEYCRQHELSYWAMGYWYKKLVHQRKSEMGVVRQAAGAGREVRDRASSRVVEVGVVVRSEVRERRAGVRVVVSRNPAFGHTSPHDPP